MDFLETFFDRVILGDGFPPRRLCGDWPGWLVALTIVCEVVIFVEYVGTAWALSRASSHHVMDRRLQPVMRTFSGVFFTCGVSHLLGGVIVFYWPLYFIIAAWASITAYYAVVGLTQFRTAVDRVMSARETAAAVAEEMTQATPERLDELAEKLRGVAS